MIRRPHYGLLIFSQKRKLGQKRNIVPSLTSQVTVGCISITRETQNLGNHWVSIKDCVWVY